MKHFFGVTYIVTKYIFKPFIYQITVSNSNSVNKTFLLSIFLYLGYSHMSVKLELVKNIAIGSFLILLACINLVYTYLTLFWNRKRLSYLITNILAIFILIFLYLTSFLAFSLLLLPNLINLKLFWINWIPDLDWEKVLQTLSEVISIISIS